MAANTRNTFILNDRNACQRFITLHMNMTLRKATADDAHAAWEIRSAAILHACKGFYPDELLDRWTAGEMTDSFVAFVVGQFYVATMDGAVAGTGAIDLEDGRIDAIFVRPDMMGKGIGKRIMAFCEELGRSVGLTELSLDATLNAAPFYRRCGFVGGTLGVYRSPRGFSLDCIPMAKRLAPAERVGEQRGAPAPPAARIPGGRRPLTPGTGEP